MALATDHARLVRETQRRTWSRMTRDYAVVAAGHGAHTAMLAAADAYWRHLTFADRTRAALGRLPAERVERIRAEMMAAPAGHQRGGQLSFASEAIYVTAIG